PRGGVPVAYEIAQLLGAPLDVYVVRKLGVPGHDELAMGALASDGTCIIDDAIVASQGVTESALRAVVERERLEIVRREHAYRDARPPPAVEGKTVIVVDDGLATGATMRAAALSLRRRHPAKIVAAVPVAAARTCKMLERVVDRIVCADTPEPFHAVGLFYQNFEQVNDDEVRAILARPGTATGHRRSA